MAQARTAKRSRRAALRTVKQYAAPFLDEPQAQTAGRELEAMAVRHQVNGIRCIDKETAFSEVEANPKHPLRSFFDWNDKSAARKQRVDYMGKLISSIQVVNVSIRKKSFEPVFVSTEAAVKQQGSNALRRTNVMRDDMLKHDPAFVSYVNRAVERMMHELKKLEHLAVSRPLPSGVQQFIDDVRASANTNGIK